MVKAGTIIKVKIKIIYCTAKTLCLRRPGNLPIIKGGGRSHWSDSKFSAAAHLLEEDPVFYFYFYFIFVNLPSLAYLSLKRRAKTPRYLGICFWDAYIFFITISFIIASMFILHWYLIERTDLNVWYSRLIIWFFIIK